MEGQVTRPADTAAMIASIADLDEDTALAIVRRRLEAGDDPLDMIRECEQGIRDVGERYARREYYVAGLIMGGEIFRQIVEILEPLIRRSTTGHAAGSVLLGTVQGDIHDLGKSLLDLLLRCHGFTVRDLGVDVAPSEFVAAEREMKPDVVALSAVMTGAYEAMRSTVVAIREGVTDGRPVPPIIIGGAMVDEQIFHYTTADYWASDAMSGVRLCTEVVARSRAAG